MKLFQQDPTLPPGYSITFRERFWAKVKKGDGCWLWTASRRSNNYGSLCIGRRGINVSAHIASWMIHFGPVPEGLLVCHRCDNPPCVRPNHLWLGTHHDNSLDAFIKGRMPGPVPLLGELNPKAKLTTTDVLEIRRLHGDAGISLAALGRMFKVTKQSIWGIIQKKNWTHV
jgi:hypothetical protein